MTIIERLRKVTLPVDRFERSDAAALADRIIDAVIGALRQKPRWRAFPRMRLELALADVRLNLERELFDQLGGLAQGDELLEAIADEVAAMLVVKAASGSKSSHAKNMEQVR